MKMKIPFLVAALLLATQSLRADGIAISNGQSIVFLGDSITRDGMAVSGWARLVVSGLASNGVVVKPIGAGAGGNGSGHMLDRLDQSAIKNPYLAGKPLDWMTLSCGVNDVNFGPTKSAVELPAFQSNVTAIIERAQAAGVKVMLLTPTMIGEDSATPQNIRMGPYLDFMRAVAKEKNCLLADLNAAMRAASIDRGCRRSRGHDGSSVCPGGVG